MIKLKFILATHKTIEYMNMSINPRNFIFSLLASLIISVTLTGCSDDKPNTSFDHPHGSDVTNLAKHKFEHKFAEQCIQREIRNSANKKSDRKRFTKPCMCIARRVMKDLTTVQAEKFMNEKKHTHTMKMNFDEAAYFCLQSKAKPKPPAIIGKR